MSKRYIWSKRFCLFGPCLLLGLILAGCDPQVALTGLITDTSGHPLPGASVKVEGLEQFAISNGNGIFGRHPGRLPVPPGTWTLRYIKTGYTTAEQTIETANGRSFEVPTVVLWPLPSARGIYDYSNHRYREWTRVEPERFLREDRAPVFGTRLKPELSIESNLGLIVGHKVSPYDWRLSRLEETAVLRDGTAAGQDGEAALDTIWAESVRIGVQAVPLDEPERLLWEIRPSRPLGPGRYALHWGAFEGDPTTDSSAYIIEVAAPATEETVEPEDPEAIDSEKADG